MLKKIYYAPYDWITSRFSPRGRGAFNTWLMIFFILSIPFQYPYKSYVSLVWALSILALVVGQLGAIGAETPVKHDDIDR